MNSFLQQIKKIHLTLCLIPLALGACVQTTQGTWQGNGTSQSVSVPTQRAEKDTVLAAPIEVALLIPLTGQGSDLGQAILNASQLALFDMGPKDFQIIPRDTKGTPLGAQIATQEAINGGADLILGPLFSSSVKSAASAAAPHRINVIGFTTDKTAVSYNSFAMGFLPNTQVKTILNYAITQGKQRFSIIVPNNQYGQIIAQTAQSTLSRQGYPAPHIHNINGQTADLKRIYEEISAYSPHAVLFGVDMNNAITISNNLIANGISNQQVQRLGLGLWDNDQRSYSSALEGAWYAAPSPLQRAHFIRSYKNTYGQTPPRLASIGYDSTALAISLAKLGGDYSKQSLTRPNGFYGLDGIFRFDQDGLVERGLAIMEFSRGRAVIRQNAPKGF
ncbi:MAG: penicillin-binding protein activator [Bdellovibrionales bacterium]